MAVLLKLKVMYTSPCENCIKLEPQSMTNTPWRPSNSPRTKKFTLFDASPFGKLQYRSARSSIPQTCRPISHENCWDSYVPTPSAQDSIPKPNLYPPYASFVTSSFSTHNTASKRLRPINIEFNSLTGFVSVTDPPLHVRQVKLNAICIPLSMMIIIIIIIVSSRFT